MAQHEWWRDAVIYQIYPRSFADADGDGVGDLAGIIGRLDHLVDLGVDAVWLSPFYPSPQHDAGYDVADYRAVDQLFGTLDDADRLIAGAHDRDLKVIVDLVPNHTSDEHAWFRAALQSPPGSPERARYVFRDGQGRDGDEPPNDWQSVFGGPAWTRVTEPDGTPGQWYLHLFDGHQPDLDWDNPEVREEFLGVLRFWLDRGVDGFRVDVSHGLVKADGLPDWPHEMRGMVRSRPDGRRPPMWDQDAVHAVYREWRQLLDTYDGDRMLVAEAWVHPLERLARYVRDDEMQQAFNFEYLMAPWDAKVLRYVIDESLAAMTAVGAPSTWVLSNHDVVRHATRLAYDDPPRDGVGPRDPQPDRELGLRRARAATLFMLALPGSAYVYQGEELGLPEHTTLPDDVRQDPTWRRTGGERVGRDGCRVPLPWEADAPAYGFSETGASWLPQPDDWGPYAVDSQKAGDDTTFALYRDALRLRRQHRLGIGDLEWVDVNGSAGGPGRVGGSEDVLAFRNGSVAAIANLGPDPVDVPDGCELLLASGPLDGGRVPRDTAVWVRSQP